MPNLKRHDKSMEEIGINKISIMLVPADSPEYGTFSLRRRQREFLYSIREDITNMKYRRVHFNTIQCPTADIEGYHNKQYGGKTPVTM